MSLLFRIILLPAVLLAIFPMITVAATRADKRFIELYEAEWAWRIREFPMMAAGLGKKDVGDSLGRVDEPALQRRLAHWKKVDADLAKIKTEDLSPAQRVNAAVYRAQLEEFMVGIESRSHLLTMNSDSSFFGDMAFTLSAPRLGTMDQANTHLAWLGDVPRWFDDHEVLMREGLKTGMTVQQVVLEGRAQPLLDVAEQKPEDTPFFKPYKSLPEAWNKADRDRLTAKAIDVIKNQVQPAYRKMHGFMVDTYIPGARKTLAARDLPDGDAFYRSQIRIFTTIDLAPDTIHQIGLDEVARIRADMEAVKTEVKFDGDMAAFFAFLRTDPQFYAKTPRELLERASYISKRIDGLLPRYFGHLPRQPYGVLPVPDSIAPFYTAGRYSPGSLSSQQSGTYLVNTYKLEARPLYVLPALTLHEAVPGHHLQGAISAEAGALPNFRRYSYLSAYGEGWALYAEHLGKEMGIYETPYEQFGRLTYEMWRACRLVVDTGVHAKGWTREQAVDYMASNTALSLHEIRTEVDRYISWPAQALSYKLGEIEIRKLRGEAEKALGPKFDLRAFHDRILGLGPVPLPVLRTDIEAWVAESKK